MPSNAEGRRTRRGNREGAIRQRTEGRWEARVRLPNGERRSVYGRTRAEVRKALAKLVAAADAGLPVPVARITVAHEADQYLAAAKLRVTHATFQHYAAKLTHHVVPTLGKILLSKLTRDDLVSLYASLLDKGLSHRTVLQVHTVVGQMLEEAVNAGHVARNVQRLLRRAVRVPYREPRALTKEETSALLAVAESEPLGAAIILGATSGMRLGEILALQWRDVDLDACELTVSGSLTVDSEGHLVIAEPKTTKSRRTLRLTGRALEALRRRRVRQLEEKMAAGEVWTDTGLVFTTTLGTAISQGNFTSRFVKPMFVKAGVPYGRGTGVTFHSLRHTAATRLLEAGTHLAVVAAQLGHARTSTTSDVYSHVSPGIAVAAAAAMEGVLAGLPSPKLPVHDGEANGGQNGGQP